MVISHWSSKPTLDNSIIFSNISCELVTFHLPFFRIFLLFFIWSYISHFIFIATILPPESFFLSLLMRNISPPSFLKVIDFFSHQKSHHMISHLSYLLPTHQRLKMSNYFFFIQLATFFWKFLFNFHFRISFSFKLKFCHLPSVALSGYDSSARI